MYCDANGIACEDGDYELISGHVCLRDGRTIRFNPMMRDATAPGRITFYDAKSADPTSADEAIAIAFKQAAERMGGSGDVAQFLGTLHPKEIDAIVTSAAVAFVRSHAGGGIAKHFATDAALDAELGYKLTAARLKHDMCEGYKPAVQRNAFSLSDAAAVVAKATAARVASVAMTNDSASEMQRLRDEADGARIARKHLVSTAWQRG